LDAGVARGAVPSLVALLKVLLRQRVQDRVLTCYAVQILHCVGGLPQFTDHVVRDDPPFKADAVPCLAACLDSPSPCVRVNACRFLGFLLSSSTDVCAALRADEPSVALLAYFTQRRAATCMSVWEGARALMYVCRGCTDVYLAGRLLRTLRFLLRVPYVQVFTDVCRGIAHLCGAVGAVQCRALLEADDAMDALDDVAPDTVASFLSRTAVPVLPIVPALVTRFAHADAQVVLSAVHATAELAAGQTELGLQRFFDAGVLPAAADLVGDVGTDADVQRATCRLLVSFATGGSVAQVRELLKVAGKLCRPLIRALIKLALHGTDDLRADAVHVLAALCLREDVARVARIRLLVDAKLIDVIAASVQSPNMRTHRAGLAALCGMLIHGRAPCHGAQTYVDVCRDRGIDRACDLLRVSADDRVAKQAESLWQVWFARVGKGTAHDAVQASIGAFYPSTGSKLKPAKEDAAITGPARKHEAKRANGAQ
jgi:hypothetical protein